MTGDTAPSPPAASLKTFMAQERRAVIDWMALWILFSAWCVLSGWGLSSIGWLNVPGVCVSFFLFVVCLILVREPLGLLEGDHARPFSRLIRSQIGRASCRER